MYEIGLNSLYNYKILKKCFKSTCSTWGIDGTTYTSSGRAAARGFVPCGIAVLQLEIIK